MCWGLTEAIALALSPPALHSTWPVSPPAPSPARVLPLLALMVPTPGFRERPGVETTVVCAHALAGSQPLCRPQTLVSSCCHPSARVAHSHTMHPWPACPCCFRVTAGVLSHLRGWDSGWTLWTGAEVQEITGEIQLCLPTPRAPSQELVSACLSPCLGF